MKHFQNLGKVTANFCIVWSVPSSLGVKTVASVYELLWSLWFSKYVRLNVNI